MSKSSDPPNHPAPIPFEEHPALRRLVAFRQYWATVFSRVVADTGNFFGWNRQTLLVPILFVLGLLFGFYLLRGEQVLDHILTVVAFGLAPVGALAVCVLLVNLARAPYLLDSERRVSIARLQSTLTGALAEDEQPQLEITFDEKRAGFVDRTVAVWNGQSEMCKLYRVAVTHRSKSTVAELVAKEVTTLTPFSRIYPPLHLRITGRHDPPEKQTRLNPKTEVFWDVVEKPNSVRDWVRLMHIEKESVILQEIERSSFIITASCDEGFPVTKLVTLGRKEWRSRFSTYR